ncbi:MAG: S9 family peptidase [Phycisphaerae bacterium]|nr:S9 family peptidase [Phycisphaerae bacterium]
MPTINPGVLFVMAMTAAAITHTTAQERYRKPPDAITRVLDTPPTPGVSLSPSNEYVLLLHRTALPPVADLAEPMLRLGGNRINPATNGPHGPRRTVGLTLRSVATGHERPITLPDGANLGGISWSADGARVAFTNTVTNGVELWVLNVGEAEAKRLAGAQINAAAGGARWMPDQRHLLVDFLPEGRGPMPSPLKTPEGPVTQESSGESAPVRTYQDLLQNAHDESVYDWVMRSQLAIVDATTGDRRDVGEAAIFTQATPSPSGEFLLVGRTVRPYSYAVPDGLFAQEWEVWHSATGKVVKKLASVPLRENIPTQGVQTGPRGFGWVGVRPATLEWVEALDGGDPRAKVPHRDRVMLLSAPFTAEPTEFLRLAHRFSGMMWLEPAAPDNENLALVNEFERERRWTYMSLATLKAGGTERLADPRLVFDRSVNDRYNNPGSPVMERLPNGRTVVKVQKGFIFLRGQGATPEGDRPFLDRMSLSDFSIERLWRNTGEEYETVLDVLDSEEGSISMITSLETPTTPPNLYSRRLPDGERRAITQFSDPLPALREIKKQIVTYNRDDGTPLSATMYTPPGYTPGTRLPLIIWAYPNEVSDASTAGQVDGSPYRFTQIGGSSHLFLTLAGYAVMDDASMPIVGDPETVNDTFVTQILSSAAAAIKKADEMGIGDPTRVGVAGHSYGAFMTANLLAHAPPGIFRAGVARSGAYNRTLTPFGFQSERRSYWEARDVYATLSPFTYADRLKTPILFIHGQIDNNPGTFPIQSERMFQAVKGQGGTARLVMLPFESHGYMAAESVKHVLAEMIDWFDKYVKPMASEGGGG